MPWYAYSQTTDFELFPILVGEFVVSQTEHRSLNELN